MKFPLTTLGTLILCFTLFQNFRTEPAEAIMLNGETTEAILKTSNGCGIGNFIIPSIGDPNQGLPPVIGAVSYNWGMMPYQILDTIPGTEIKNVAFRRDGWSGKQILILDPSTSELDTFMVNYKLDYFKYPNEESSGFGHFNLSWIGSKWEGGLMDTVYLGEMGSGFVEVLGTGAFPKLINATYGCWVSVNENELEKIKFEYYPNPTTSKVTINLIGLTKGKQYTLDIIDNIGKLHFNTKLTAYEKIELPLQHLPKGVYYLKLDTGKNVISKKLMVQ